MESLNKPTPSEELCFAVIAIEETAKNMPSSHRNLYKDLQSKVS